MRTYEFKRDITLPYGRVRGGKGYQTFFPDNVNPEDYLKYIEEESLK